MSRMIMASLSISRMQFRKWIRKPEVYLVLLCLTIFISSRVMPVRVMIEATDVPAFPYMFPFLFADQQMGFFVLAGSIILFAEAPFWSVDQSEVLIRTGRKAWTIGQILYIVLASLLYLASVLVISIVVLLPHIQTGDGWGSIWNTIAQTDATLQFDMNLRISYYIISRYTPLQAMVLQFFLSSAVSIFLGVSLFILNMHFGKKVGIGVTSFWALFTLRINSFPEWIRWAFPTVWSNMNIVRQESSNVGLTIYNGSICIVIIDVALMILAVLISKKKDLV